MSLANKQCLICCAKALSVTDIDSPWQLKDCMIFCHILGWKDEVTSFEKLHRELIDFFNQKLSCTFEDNDDGLYKMLLLVIVVYILQSTDNNKKVIMTNLCNKIPLDLHKNACAMFAPIIMRYTDGDDITDLDLERCLNENDKENQMMFFSPVKANEKSKEQHTFATHKQKIHQGLKASRNYESFNTSFDDELNEFEETSSLIQLVNYVQSPDYQTKKLMKSNRDLGRNVNELEYQLYMNSNFETELEKTLSRWKEKCKSLENKLKDVQNMLKAKEDEIIEKNNKINEYFIKENHNKRLEERIKDYQDKITEYQSINVHYDSTIEENKKLKIENNHLSHYYSLAKQRRIELEKLSKEIEHEKKMNLELKDTKEKLSSREAQLMELQNHIHSLQRNNFSDSLSETSFNNSFYIPEPMSFVVEKDKIDLLNELNQLKEVSVHRDIHESTVASLNNQICKFQELLENSNKQMTILNEEKSSIINLCECMKENKHCDIPVTGFVKEVKELLEKYSLDIFNLSETQSLLSAEKNSLEQSQNEKEFLITNLNNEIHELHSKLKCLENGFKRIIDSFSEYNTRGSEDFVYIIDQELTNKNSLINECKIKLTFYREELQRIKNILPIISKNINDLRRQIQQCKSDSTHIINEIFGDISIFNTNLTQKVVNTTFANSLFQSLYDWFQAYIRNSEYTKEIEKKYEETQVDIVILQRTKEEMERTMKEMENKINQDISVFNNELASFKSKTEIDHQNYIDFLKITLENDFDGIKENLMKKHMAEKEEMNFDFKNLFDKYHKCLSEIDKHEKNIQSKDNSIITEIKKYNNAIKKIQEKDEEIVDLKKTLNNYVKNISVTDKEVVSLRKLLEEKCNTFKVQDVKIKDLQNELKEMIQNEAVLKEDLESLKKRYNELQNIYESSKVLDEEIKLQMQELINKKGAEIAIINEDLQKKDSEIIRIKLKVTEDCNNIEKLLLEKLVVDNELKEIKLREKNNLNDIFIKDGKLSILEKNLDIFTKEISSLKNKCSNSDLEIEKLGNEIIERNLENDKVILEKSNEIELLKITISSKEEQLQSIRLSFNDNLNKISVLEQDHVMKNNKINELNETIESLSSQLNSLKSSFKIKEDIVTVQQKDLEMKTANLNLLREEIDRNVSQLSEMSSLIKVLEESNRENILKATTAASEILTSKELCSDFVYKNAELQSKVDELVHERQLKEVEHTNAMISISNFSLIIKKLESTIESEMQNYEKISIEYKHAEEESTSYLNKYNSLVKERQNDLNNHQEIINRLTNRMHKIEEERDDQIHEMERLFNTKIFDLQQVVEDNAIEVKSLKEENIENRKTHKLKNLHLEDEIDRLQKALQNREHQFQEEKCLLKSNIESEREDKLKYKECFEIEICKLENKIKSVEEKKVTELKESQLLISVLEGNVNELQVTNYKLLEELKEKEEQYENEIISLKERVKELEPLENTIHQLEEKTRRLLNKCNQLDASDNLMELNQIRSRNKSLSDYIISLEKNEKTCALEKTKMEQQIQVLTYECEDLVKVKNELKEFINTIQEQLQSSESRSESRLVKIENYEREIKTLTSDNDAMKRRYLMLRDINERHNLEVEKDHQTAVDTYIARIESLTRDVASFQEQLQLVTEERNTLVEKSYSSKRIIDEQTAKLDGLQKLVWNHTENERRHMLTTFDEKTRFTRMSHWTDKPQLQIQLPPVSRINPEISESLRLNQASRSRLESYLFTPYSCEDEYSISMTKDLPLPPLPPRKTLSTVNNVLSTPISTPIRTKKKKEGIRLQLSNKIRRSLHLDPETPKLHKQCPEMIVTDGSFSIKSEMSASTKVSSTTSSKPPLPKKGFFSVLKSNLKSSDVDVLAVSDVRKKEKIKSGDTHYVAPSTSSLYSVTSPNQETGIRQTNMIKRSTCEDADGSHFSQTAKTPKPNSVIKKMIRRSKNLSPKRRSDIFDNM